MNGRVWKRRHNSLIDGMRQPARVVEMQMRQDDVRDRSRIDFAVQEARKQPFVRIDREKPLLFLGVFRAVPGFDDDPPSADARSFDQQTVARQMNVVISVGRESAAPERLGDDAEHRPAVEAELPAGQQPHRQSAEVDRSG
ncbi:MAG: hypothetical protein HZB38_06485 [Planctomycetes bacterium]|nr:hypothetical protein [Planctomycetota bacterium]